jgi:hypothetical protein
MAINWSPTIPKDPRGQAFPLKRTPATGVLRALVTSEQLIGCDTHFYKGHTMPCERPGCEACEKGMPFRWHGYLSAIESKTRLHFIFEFTAQAGDAFDQYYKAHGTLRGCLFEAHRLHHRPNGRVIIQCKPMDLQSVNLPTPPDVPACMSIIWNLPAGQVNTDSKVNGRAAMTNTQQTLSRFTGDQDSPLKILDTQQ